MRLANQSRIALLSLKMRAKVGSIVSRSSSVSFTSKTIRGSLAMGQVSFLLPGCFLGDGSGLPSALVPEPFAMSRLLGAIAADRHAAPAPRAPCRVVGKQQRAATSFARFNVGKIFLADELRQLFADRQQQRFRRSPAARLMQFQAIAVGVMMTMDLAERFIAREKFVEGIKLAQRALRKRLAHVLADKAAAPFPQLPRLIGDLIEFAGFRARLGFLQNVTR